ncbi:MAG: hypothetical protein C4539_17695 [Ignavibacteriales bacterium]|nr:MAG: hypothetical protein C4539_17695 [Ignavibacteriales bacterium]
MKYSGSLFVAVIFSISFLFLSCENPKTELKVSTSEKSDYTQLKTKIDKLNQILEDAILIPDYEKILSYYTDNIVAMQEFNQTIKGKDKMKALCDARINAGVKFHKFDFKIDTCWSNGSEVIEYGKIIISSSSKENPVPFEQTGGYCKIFEIKNDSTYLIKYMIANLDFNPCVEKK